jgi:hypothetical protein
MRNGDWHPNSRNQAIITALVGSSQTSAWLVTTGNQRLSPDLKIRFEEVPLGINCEKCHGPGSIHMEEKQAGIIVDITKEIDFSIVNPESCLQSVKWMFVSAATCRVRRSLRAAMRPLIGDLGQELAAHRERVLAPAARFAYAFYHGFPPRSVAQSECFKDHPGKRVVRLSPLPA